MQKSKFYYINGLKALVMRRDLFEYVLLIYTKSVKLNKNL